MAVAYIVRTPFLWLCQYYWPEDRFGHGGLRDVLTIAVEQWQAGDVDTFSVSSAEMRARQVAKSGDAIGSVEVM